jgi:hypothetical protein
MKIISSSYEHKILAVRENYLLPIFFGSWAKAKAVFTMAKMSSFCQMVIFYLKKNFLMPSQKS